MAEIYGITLKGCKEFEGREARGVQGNIYMDGKKVGFYNDMGNGGMSDIDYNSTEIRNEVSARINRFFVKYPELYGNEGSFYCKVLQLMDYEKYLKQANKKGFTSLLAQDPLYDIDIFNLCRQIFYFKAPLTLEEIIKKHGLEKYPHIRAYSSLQEFYIKEE